MDLGSKYEKLLTKLISEPLLYDFVHLGPKIKNNKYNKALCDLLIEDEPIAIIVELKTQNDEITRQGRNQINWTSNQIKKAIRQVNGGIRNLNLVDIICNNPKRGKIIFTKNQLEPKHGIIIIDYNSEPYILNSNIENRTKRNIPLHYFTFNNFVWLCKQLKTLPDLLEYLNERSKIPLWARPRLNDENNIYAYYLMNKCKFEYTNQLKDFENCWNTLTTEYKDKYLGKLNEDQEAKQFDLILNELYKLEGVKWEFNTNNNINIDVKDTDRVEISRQLNRISLLHRRNISKKFIEKMLKADNNPNWFNYFTSFSEDRKKAYFFLSTALSAEKRKEVLLTLSTCLYDLYNEIQTVVGVATENMHSTKGRSYDFIYIKDIERDNDIEHIKTCKQFFDELRFEKIYDFPSDKPRLFF